MRILRLNMAALLFSGLLLVACGSDDSDASLDDAQPDNMLTELPAAFAVFDTENTTIQLDGDEIIIESNGLPNHTSPYWSSDHPLFSEPVATSFEQMAPGNIDDFNGSYSLTIPAVPTKSSSSSATGLGSIGIAVSGAMIYNDEEGPNVPLDDAAPSLDYNGAHTGPQSYHYHLEPTAWSEDDDNLIGVMADGFFLYGRRCAATESYPDDLDASGGHTSSTKYNDQDEYHYHIENELYLNQYYMLFPGDYQGSPNGIN